jgi:ABC-2 type transport system permease protein
MKALRPFEAIRLVARRELRQRVRSRSFKVGTVVIAVLAGALAFLPSLVPDPGERDWTVALVGSAPAPLERSLEAAPGATISLRRVDEGDAAAVARRDGIDAVLVDGREIVVGSDGDDALVRVLTGAVAQSRLTDELGVEPGAVPSARDVPVRRLGDTDDGDGGLVTLLGVLALFFAIATYGAWVLNSVLEEKSNRVVEIVVSTIAPRQLLAGKVIGNGLAGLAQFTVVVAVAVVVATASGALEEIPSGGPATLISVIGWFVLGFGFYAVGYAAAGSLVSRQEDAQSAVSPMMTVVLTGYFVSIFVVNPDPGSTAARIVSLIPIVTPMAMPARIAAGEVAVWEVVLAVAIMIASTWLMVRVAARIYTAALLRTGGRVPVRQALRSAVTSA